MDYSKSKLHRAIGLDLFGIPIWSIGDKDADARNNAKAAQEIADQKAIDEAMMQAQAQSSDKNSPIIIIIILLLALFTYYMLTRK